MERKFITIEGPDGSGKSTIIKQLRKHYSRKNVDILFTREPGGTQIGEEIRDIILNKKNTRLGKEAEALLYAASRAQHIHELIEPTLKAGKNIISDRFLLSSLAYQGVGRDLGVEKVREINEFGLKGIEPDLILFFYIDPETTLKRKFRHSKEDRLELEGNAFHNKVYNGYMELMNKYPKNIKKIDATQSISQVKRKTIEAIDAVLK